MPLAVHLLTHMLPFFRSTPPPFLLKCGRRGTIYTHTHMYKVKCKQLRNLTSRKVEPRAYKAKTKANKQTDRQTDRGRPRHTSKYYNTILAIKISPCAWQRYLARRDCCYSVCGAASSGCARVSHNIHIYNNFN